MAKGKFAGRSEGKMEMLGWTGSGLGGVEVISVLEMDEMMRMVRRPGGGWQSCWERLAPGWPGRADPNWK